MVQKGAGGHCSVRAARMVTLAPIIPGGAGVQGCERDRYSWENLESLMAIGNVADLFVATLEQAGVKRIYGIVGDSLNGLTEALRRRGTIEWVHVRHEETAAFAAAAEAQTTGNLAVCAGSCGPGNL